MADGYLRKQSRTSPAIQKYIKAAEEDEALKKTLESAKEKLMTLGDGWVTEWIALRSEMTLWVAKSKPHLSDLGD